MSPKKRYDQMWCCASVTALFCPPLAVLLMTGCSVEFLLNCLLTFLVFIPGLIHAFCIIYCPDHVDPDAKDQVTEQALRRKAQREAAAAAARAQAEAAAQAAQQPPPPPPPPEAPQTERL